MRSGPLGVFAIVVCAVPGGAAAGTAAMTVSTAPPRGAWQEGRASPFVVTLTGLGRGAARVSCYGTTSGYSRAQAARNKIATPLVMDAMVRAVVSHEELSCSAYVGDRWVASWSGRVAWPAMTLPDHRMTSLVANRCGTAWCVDVEIDRTHPGSVGAELEVQCDVRTPSSDPEIARIAPQARAAVATRNARTRVKVEAKPGATAMTCTLDRGLYNLARFADADPNNNASQTTVVTPPVTARVAFVKVDRDARWTDGCGSCSTYVPGSVALAMRVRNDGPDDIDGVGITCAPAGTPLVLAGASNPIGAGETKEVVVSLERSAAVAKQLVGSIATRCALVVWGAAPATRVPSWSGVVRFQ